MFYNTALEPENLRSKPYGEGILIFIDLPIDGIFLTKAIDGVIFFSSKCVKIDVVVYMATDKVVSIRDIEDKEIISSLNEGGIFFVAVDRIPRVRENLSENGSTSIDPTPGWSGKCDGNLHMFDIENNEMECMENRRKVKIFICKPSRSFR